MLKDLQNKAIRDSKKARLVWKNWYILKKKCTEQLSDTNGVKNHRKWNTKVSNFLNSNLDVVQQRKLHFERKHLQEPAQKNKNHLWKDETNMNLNDCKRKVWKREGIVHDQKNTTSYIRYDGDNVMQQVTSFQHLIYDI